jgi:hypothetical protein
MKRKIPLDHGFLLKDPHQVPDPDFLSQSVNLLNRRIRRFEIADLLVRKPGSSSGSERWSRPGELVGRKAQGKTIHGGSRFWFVSSAPEGGETCLFPITK